MHQLFTPNAMNGNSRIDVPSFNNARNLINREVDRIIAYYRNSQMVVSPTHLLKQILEHLNVSEQRDLASFTTVCYDEVGRIAKLFNLINPEVMDPAVFNGTFYNTNTTEFIVTDETFFDYSEAYENWKMLTPIRVHYHGFSDLNLPLLTGNYRNPVRETGIAVISINIPMLALQYRAWKEKERNTEDEVNSRTESFLLRYPILNMSYNHVEIALINRTLKLYEKKPVGKFFRLHPINVVDVTSVVDDCLNSRIKLLQNRQFRFRELFPSFNALRKEHWIDVLEQPSIAPVRNTKWVVDLMYCEYTLFLLKYFSKVEMGAHYNLIKRELKNLETDSIFYKDCSFPYNSIFMHMKQELGI